MTLLSDTDGFGAKTVWLVWQTPEGVLSGCGTRAYWTDMGGKPCSYYGCGRNLGQGGTYVRVPDGMNYGQSMGPGTGYGLPGNMINEGGER